MKLKFLWSLLSVALFMAQANAQTIYVDPNHGDDSKQGDPSAPLKSLEKAVQQANALTGTGEIRIRLMPGVYVLDDKVVVNPVRVMDDSTYFIIEAAILPGDSSWTPTKTPVIQSVSLNNSDTQFPHATGLLIASEHVKIRGLKFLGNTHPDVLYYYPVSRENPALKDLEVSQCYFIAEKNTAGIQGGIWAHGPEINVNHCVFKSCRNAVLVFKNIQACSIRHNIIDGAIESALWVGWPGEFHDDFIFDHNVVSNSQFFWVSSYEGAQSYTIRNTVFSNLEHYIGQWDSNKQALVVKQNHVLQEKNVIRQADVSFVERNEARIPHDYLHLQPSSDGYEMKVGVFK